MDVPGGAGPDRAGTPGRHAAADSRRGGRDGRRADATAGPTRAGADGWSVRESVLPLSFGPAPRGSVDGPDRAGPERAGHDGPDRVQGGGFAVPPSWRRPLPSASTEHDGGRHRPVEPWPALPDETGTGRACGAGRPFGAGQPTGANGTTEPGTAHRDPWPALPDEPSPRASAARGARFRDALLDREQAGG
ncbi:hypothetical protein TPA0908_50240 [Micromonospora sp. AKA38]|nr:hypothetical protein TPA0908_50240 [Micromonospora sp. AKA38]